MQVRTIKSHKSAKLLAIGAIALIGLGLWLMPKKGGLPVLEVDRLVRPVPHGKFSGFNDLSSLDMTEKDFVSDIAENRHRAIDPRIRTGQKESIARHYYLPSGDRVESEFVISIKEATPTTVTIERKGVLRRVGEDWQDFREVIECKQKVQHLSSGVARPSLRCESEISGAALEQEIESCRVEPFGPRSRNSKTLFGDFKNQKGQMFDRVTHETITTEGDIICSEGRMGRGRETIVLVSTAEQPTVQDPALGARKKLFAVKTIMTKTGAVVFRSRQEILGSQTPNLEVPALKLARKGSHKLKALKGANSSLKGSKKALRKAGKKVAKR